KPRNKLEEFKAGTVGADLDEKSDRKNDHLEQQVGDGGSEDQKIVACVSATERKLQLISGSRFPIDQCHHCQRHERQRKYAAQHDTAIGAPAWFAHIGAATREA